MTDSFSVSNKVKANVLFKESANRTEVEKSNQFKSKTETDKTQSVCRLNSNRKEPIVVVEVRVVVLEVCCFNDVKVLVDVDRLLLDNRTFDLKEVQRMGGVHPRLPQHERRVLDERNVREVLAFRSELVELDVLRRFFQRQGIDAETVQRALHKALVVGKVLEVLGPQVVHDKGRGVSNNDKAVARTGDGNVQTLGVCKEPDFVVLVRTDGGEDDEVLFTALEGVDTCDFELFAQTQDVSIRISPMSRKRYFQLF